MARKKYITSHSNYVVKKQHALINDGIIYERDYMTLSPLNTITSNEIQVYGEGNFKLTIGTGGSQQIKHNYGEWEIWDNSNNTGEISRDGKIVLNPNYSSLLDFAYYGSCVSLVETAISNIIKKYPGELYFSEKQIMFINEEGKNTFLGDNNMYVVENPFLINIIDDNIENTNDSKFLLNNIYDYILLNKNDVKYIENYNKIVFNVGSCPDNGTKVSQVTLDLSDNSSVTLYTYFYEGNNYILYNDENLKNCHIRLNEEKIENIFKTYDDFENILLNRDSNPLYKCILDTPSETVNGVVSTKKPYIWPTNGGWNLDVSSSRYVTYVNSLLDIASFYDEYYTNNIWRMLTHTSIKNMDNSFVSLKNDENYDDFVIGGGRIEKILKVYGRQYDDIKRYIENIKVTNNITYDRKNNIPDYFLTDSLELSGWDINNIMPTQKIEKLSDILYPNTENKKYNSLDANIEFLRRLKMSSKYLLSLKGTKLGIETILKLFGLTSDEFEINEYVAVANNIYKPSADTVKKYNRYKKTYYDENTINNIPEDELQGLPVKEVVYERNGEIFNYLIPWFDKKLSYDGNIYFQMNGGWGKTNEKKITNHILTNINKLDGITIYDESAKYLHFVNKLSELTKLNINNLSNDDIYYVYDISEMDTLYYKKTDSASSNNNYSNYFILKNTDYSNILGSIDTKEGWINISKESIFNANTDDAKKVIYLESIIENNKGNAPHIGYGKYDNGEEYLDYFRHLFKYSIENNNFIDDSDAYSCDTGSLEYDIKNAGFEVDSQIDNIKCWYFTNTNNMVNEDKTIIQKINYNITNDRYTIDNSINKHIPIGSDFPNKLYSSNISPINLENIFQSDGEGILPSYDEAAANSIINIKNMDIIVKNNSEEFIDYFNEKILPYVKQMIPSTTIWNIKFENNNHEDSSNSFISL